MLMKMWSNWTLIYYFGKQFLIDMHILCEPAIKILDVYPKEIKTYVHKKDLYQNVPGSAA